MQGIGGPVGGHGPKGNQGQLVSEVSTYKKTHLLVTQPYCDIVTRTMILSGLYRVQRADLEGKAIPD